MIEPTKENVEAYTVKHAEEMLNDLWFETNETIEKVKKTCSGLDINDNGSLTRAVLNDYSNMFNPKLMSHHRPVTRDGREYLEYIDDMSGLDTEIGRLIAFSNDGKSIKKIDMVIPDATSIAGKIPPQVLINKITSLPIDDSFIYVHNHPHVIAVEPSTADIRVFTMIRILTSCSFMKLEDCVIIGPMDFYSQRQNEDGHRTNDSNVFQQPILSEKLLSEIDEENPYVSSVIKDLKIIRKKRVRYL